ncbi:MAG: peptide deformylase [Nitrospinota bacterium]|nr:peptide deformylase [Nitrospinota bacterium]
MFSNTYDAQKKAPAVMAEPVGILKYPHSLLASTSAPVDRIDSSIRAISQRMLATMLMAPGFGLAANQVGVPKRILTVNPARIMDEPAPGPMVMINPEVRESRGGEWDEEGCLSLPGLYGFVKRPTWAILEYTDLEGEKVEMEAEGYLARCLLHELDHLDGTLFWDRLPTSQRNLLKLKFFTRMEWAR